MKKYDFRKWEIIQKKKQTKEIKICVMIYGERNQAKCAVINAKDSNVCLHYHHTKAQNFIVELRFSYLSHCQLL